MRYYDFLSQKIHTTMRAMESIIVTTENMTRAEMKAFLHLSVCAPLSLVCWLQSQLSAVSLGEATHCVL